MVDGAREQAGEVMGAAGAAVGAGVSVGVGELASGSGSGIHGDGAPVGAGVSVGVGPGRGLGEFGARDAGVRESVAREVWGHRRLLGMFASRELRIRFAGSSLGVFWSVVHPALLMLLYIVIFSRLLNVPVVKTSNGTANYAIYLIPALLSWNWFSEALQGACGSIQANAGLLRKVAFPSAILPLTPILVTGIPLMATLVVFCVGLVVFGAAPVTSLVLLPFMVVFQALVLVGPAYLLSSLQVALRDTAPFLTALLQILFWMTPVVYPPQLIADAYPPAAVIVGFNPALHLVEAWRDVVLSGRLPRTDHVLILAAFGLVTWHAGRAVFLRTRRSFADEA